MKLLKNGALVTVILGIGLFATGCGLFSVRDENRKAPLAEVVDEQEFEYYTVDIGDIKKTRTDYCSSAFMKPGKLKFEIREPIITNVYVQAGDTVKYGDLIAEAENTFEKAEAEQYKSDIRAYQSEVDYYTALIESENKRKLAYEKYGVPYNSRKLIELNEALDESAEKLAETELLYYSASQRLEKTYLYSSSEGTVGYVRASGIRPLLTVDVVASIYSDLNEITTVVSEKEHFYRSFSEYDAKYFYSVSILNELGEKETIECSGPVTLKCTRVYEEEVTWSDSNYIWYCFEISNEDNERINEEVSAEVGIDISTLDEDNISFYYEIETVFDSAEQVLRVPVDMLIRIGNPEDPDDPFYAVYVIGENGLREMRYVQIGVMGDIYAEITGGLSEGEIVMK